MILKTEVLLTNAAIKQIRKLPRYIRNSLQLWIEAVEEFGIREVRKRPGLHDEVLQGRRFGQRSVRLNKAYRVIYVETQKEIEIQIIEVNKHAY